MEFGEGRDVAQRGGESSPVSLTEGDLTSLDVLREYPTNGSRQTAEPVDYDSLTNAEHPRCFSGTIGSLPESSGVGEPVRLSGADLQSLDVLTDYPCPAPVKTFRNQIRDGERFVSGIADLDTLWGGDAGTPWHPTTEEYVDLALANAEISRGFLVGVLHVLRDAKREVQPRELAAGFLVLSNFSLDRLGAMMPGINFEKTCDAGCEHGEGVVRAAALFTRRSLGLPQAA